MEDQIIVHGRIMERHPELTPDDIAHAWGNRIASGNRLLIDLNQIVAVGFDSRGRMVEMVAVIDSNGETLVFHAMTPPSTKTLKEVNLI